MSAIGVDVVVVEDVVVLVEPGVGHAEDMALSFLVTFVLGSVNYCEQAQCDGGTDISHVALGGNTH